MLQFGYVCGQRSGNETVQGCIAEMPIPKEDYCIKPPTDEKYLILQAFRFNKTDLTTPGYPLGECEGECDSDDDCMVSRKLSMCFSSPVFVVP